MRAKPAAKAVGTGVIGPLSICAGIHVLADLVLINRAWFLENESLLVAIALPLSQCSLAAVWAACSRRSSPYLRFAMPISAAFGCWYVLGKLLPWGIGEDASAAWAIAIAVQMLATLMAIGLYKLTESFRQPKSVDADGANQTWFTFQLRTLMLWTTVVAIGFGFVQFGRSHWQWTAGVAKWDNLWAMPMIGMFNALMAFSWLWAFAVGRWQWRIAKTVVVTILIGVSGYSLSSLLGWTAATTISHRQGMVLAISQSLFVIISLAVVLRQKRT